jgi:hypothetical protein
VRVILLAIVCDHPAMCKVSGFADHAHNAAPCTKCEVTQAELFSEKSLANGKYIGVLIFVSLTDRRGCRISRT